MTADALVTLKQLAQQARAAADAAAANEVLAQAGPIAHDEALPASRDLGLALLDVASALAPLGAPGAVEDLFLHSQRVLVASSDIRVDDHLLLWHKLGALYDQHGATDLRNQTLARIGDLAESFTGPLERRGVEVFLEQAMLYRRQGQTGPMLVMLRQVHRHRNSEASAPADRLSWLEIYAAILLGADRADDAAPLLAQAVELAHDLGDAEREASMLHTIGRAAFSRNDGAAALPAFERARRVIEGAPALADTELAAAVLHNLVTAQLTAADASRYPEALALNERGIGILRRMGLTGSDDFAHALYQRAVLTEYLGDWAGAARGYAEAAAVTEADAGAATEWLSLAGRAWFEAGEFDAASDCYLAAVRRRVAASSPA